LPQEQLVLRRNEAGQGQANANDQCHSTHHPINPFDRSDVSLAPPWRGAGTVSLPELASCLPEHGADHLRSVCLALEAFLDEMA
jgi:hypothetical protein